MESFFLAETTKYLYLLFDPDNVLNNDGGHGTVITTPNGECIIEAGGFVFNTEAHPIDPGALNCCYNQREANTFVNFDSNKFRGSIYEFPVTGTVEDEAADDNGFNSPKMTAPFLVNSTTTTTVNIQTKVDPEETRKKMVAEIMSVLKENKFNRENTPDERPKSPSVAPAANTIDDSIILSVPPTKQSEDVDHAELLVEVVKLPAAAARDADDNKSTIQIVDPTDFISHEEENASSDSAATNVNSLIQNENAADKEASTTRREADEQFKSYFETDKYLAEDSSVAAAVGTTTTSTVTASSIDENATTSTNNSMLTEFVHSVLMSTLPPKPKFNPQDLLEKIRANNANRTSFVAVHKNNYKLLTCKAQPYLQRITALGEFY